MAYLRTIKKLAQFTTNLGPNAHKDQLHALYLDILSHWFLSKRGLFIKTPSQAVRKPEYTVIRPTECFWNPVLVVDLKRPNQWTAGGRQNVVDDLRKRVEPMFELTQYNTIYGVTGIGLHWAAWKVEKKGDHVPVPILDWQMDVVSDESFVHFQRIAKLVYNIT